MSVQPPAPPLTPEVEELVFTHKSLYGKPSNMVVDAEDPKDWERVSFLGEGVVYAAISNLLYTAFPRHRTSHLKPTRLQYLSKESLATITDAYRWMENIRCVESSRQNIARSLDNRAALAESFVGGVALSHGMDYARKWAEEVLRWKHNIPLPSTDTQRTEPPMTPPRPQVPQSPPLQQPLPPTTPQHLSTTPFGSPSPQYHTATQSKVTSPASAFGSPHLLSHEAPLAMAAFGMTPYTPAQATTAFPAPGSPVIPSVYPQYFNQPQMPSSPPMQNQHYAMPMSSEKPWVVPSRELQPHETLKVVADSGFGLDAPKSYAPPPVAETSKAIPLPQPQPQPQSTSSSAVPKTAATGSLAKLNEIAARRAQKVQWDFVSEGQGQYIVWTARLSVKGDFVAEATGQSKQVAKEATARLALETLNWQS